MDEFTDSPERVQAALSAVESIPTEQLEAGIIGEMADCIRDMKRLFRDEYPDEMVLISKVDEILERLEGE